MQSKNELLIHDRAENGLTSKELWKLIMRILEIDRSRKSGQAKTDVSKPELYLNNIENNSGPYPGPLYGYGKNLQTRGQHRSVCQGKDFKKDDEGMDEKMEVAEEKLNKMDLVAAMASYYGMSREMMLDYLYKVHRKAEITRLCRYQGIDPERAGEIFSRRMAEVGQSLDEAGEDNSIAEEIEEFERLRPKIAEKLRSGEIDALPERVVYYLKNGGRLALAWLRYENDALLNDCMKMIERMHYLEKALKEERAKNL